MSENNDSDFRKRHISTPNPQFRRLHTDRVQREPERKWLTRSLMIGWDGAALDGNSLAGISRFTPLQTITPKSRFEWEPEPLPRKRVVP